MKHITMKDVRVGMIIWYANYECKIVQKIYGRTSIAIMYETKGGSRRIATGLSEDQEYILLDSQDLKDLNGGYSPR